MFFTIILCFTYRKGDKLSRKLEGNMHSQNVYF
jgi:hypothetical protein